MWFVYLLIFVAGFAGGWAFYKHRDRIKMKAQIEESNLKRCVEGAEDKALNMARPTRTPRG